MAAVEIRLATEADAEAIAAILREAFGELRDGYTSEAFAIVTPPADEIRRRIAEGPNWITFWDGEPVATVSAVPEPEWLYIRSMAVLPSAQGLRLGSRLLETIEEYAVANGFDTLFLYTTGFSTNAIRLYENHGFIRERETTAEEWYGTPGLAMIKKLDK